ncbi:MAG: TolC family protein [Lachnospiraceae bacterium]|nr:TolC family protein [Lachnospiraceae bacterium]
MKIRLTAAALAAVLVTAGAGIQTQAVSADLSAGQSGEENLTLESSLELALASDAEYITLTNELAVQRKNLRQAVIAAGGSDEEDEAWSALLEVTLSEGDGLAEYYSVMTQPTLLGAEVSLTEAKLNSRKVELESEIANLYIQMITCQERISVQEELLEEKNTSLTKTKALVKSGQEEASLQESLEDEVDALKESLEEDRDALKTVMEELSSLIGEELAEDTVFDDAEVDDTLWEGHLEELTDWAVQKDEGCLSAWKDCLEALLEMWTDYTVLNEEYPIPDSIFEYIVSAAAGESIDTEAFYEEYTAYWEERQAALEAAKALNDSEGTADETAGDETAAQTGEENQESESAEETAEETQASENGDQTGGTAQTTEEDAPEEEETEEEDAYAFHDAILEYQNRVLEMNTQVQEVTKNVEEAYDSLMSLRDTYLSLQEEQEELQGNQKLYRVRYRLGELSKEEYQSLTEEMETLRLDILEAGKEYRQAYYSLNSVTGGGLSAIASGGLLVEETGEETADEIEKAGIVVLVRAYPGEQTFSLEVSVPEEYAEDIVSFELWNGDTRIGSRTGTDEVLAADSLSDISELQVRFYDAAGGELGAYEIDTAVPVTVLTVKTAVEMK